MRDTTEISGFHHHTSEAFTLHGHYAYVGSYLPTIQDIQWSTSARMVGSRSDPLYKRGIVGRECFWGEAKEQNAEA